MTEANRAGPHAGRDRTRSWIRSIAVVAPALCVCTTPTRSETGEHVFTAPATIWPGELMELTGPDLPTEGVRVVSHTLAFVDAGSRYPGPTYEAELEWDVHSVESGRILVRVRTGSVGLLNASGTYRGLEVLSGGEVWLPDGPIALGTPEVHRVEPETAAPGDVISIHGAHMGLAPSTAPPSGVRVGGRPAEVLSWSRNLVTARLHPRTPAGLLGVAIPGTRIEGALVVSGLLDHHGPAKRSSLQLRFGKRFRKLRVRSAEYDAATGTLVLLARRHGTVQVTKTRMYDCFWGFCSSEDVRVTRNTWQTIRIRLPLDVDRRPAPFTIRQDDVAVPDDAVLAYGSVRSPRPPTELPALSLGHWAVHVHSADERRIVASFSGGGIEGRFVVRRR